MKQKKLTHTVTPEPPLPPIPGTMTYKGQVLDILLHAWLARFCLWLSPASLGLALYDWLAHLSLSPAKQLDDSQKSLKKVFDFLLICAHCLPYTNMSIGIEKQIHDPRFKNDLWQNLPFILYAQAFLLKEELWNEITTNLRGVSKHHKNVVNFLTRQMLDVTSPSNFAWTNPEVIHKTFKTGGINFVKGTFNYLEDLKRYFYNEPPAGTEKFKVGVNIGITPGKVIYRNRLIELIQYEPKTPKVYAEPILIIPAWIMKYYILDLSPHNSLAKYLVDNGHTVFMISWKNPGSEDRDLAFEDYMNFGILESLEVIHKIIPKRKIHTVGYCIGGTLLMIAASALGADPENNVIKTITLFAAQIDFREAGVLQLFIDESQITYLEDIMWEKGYLEGKQMATAFSMLHSNDLIWSRMIHDYLLGERRPMTDLMAWDVDTTRLPFRMHSEYLHNLFLNNELVNGRFRVNRKKVALTDVKVPIFAVGTISDHVSPWRSVYKVHLFTDTEITFVLTSGGHNAGIVSEPGHKGRTFQIQTRKANGRYITPENWHEKAEVHIGSWWLSWQQWLVQESTKKVALPSVGCPQKGLPILCDAPGTYVHEK